MGKRSAEMSPAADRYWSSLLSLLLLPLSLIGLATAFDPADPRCQYHFPMESAQRPMEDKYFDLLRNNLVGLAYAGTEEKTQFQGAGGREDLRKYRVSLAYRTCGHDLPYLGLTMTGVRRIDALKRSIQTIIRNQVPGDIIECGVWMGGSSAFILGALKAYGGLSENRQVYLADSYNGFKGIETMPEDVGMDFVPYAPWDKSEFVAIQETKVQQNLDQLGLWDKDYVHSIKGFFNESLPKLAPKLGSVSILRLDGDMYESTMDILYNLYGKVSIGGIIIIDDYWISNCRIAIHEFRAKHGIVEPLTAVDQSAQQWTKSRHVPVDGSEWTRRKKQ